MIDMRQGRCAVCGASELIHTSPARFGHGDMEYVAAVTYKPGRLTQNRYPDTPYGHLEHLVCRTCGFTQSFAKAPGSIPIGPRFRTSLHRGKHAAGQRNPGRRRIPARSPVLLFDEDGVSMIHGGRIRAAIKWATTFHTALSRAPIAGLCGPVAEVHALLRQRVGVETVEIGVTLCLTDSPAIQALEPLSAFLPRVEGEQAVEALDTIRTAASLHGAALAI